MFFSQAQVQPLALDGSPTPWPFPTPCPSLLSQQGAVGLGLIANHFSGPPTVQLNSLELMCPETNFTEEPAQLHDV